MLWRIQGDGDKRRTIQRIYSPENVYKFDQEKKFDGIGALRQQANKIHEFSKVFDANLWI